jgi:hypothetical protein
VDCRGVAAQVGRLIHRPGLELSRVTPGNINALLFDDVMWAPEAKEEHDAVTVLATDEDMRKAPSMSVDFSREYCDHRGPER